MSEIQDRLLTDATLELLRRLEATLKPDGAALVALYNQTGADLDVVTVTLNEREQPGEVQRMLQLLIHRLQREDRGPVLEYRNPEPQREGRAPIITSVRVIPIGSGTGPHERVAVWNRRGLAGELVVERGDGVRIAAALGCVDGRMLGGVDWRALGELEGKRVAEAFLRDHPELRRPDAPAETDEDVRGQRDRFEQAARTFWERSERAFTRAELAEARLATLEAAASRAALVLEGINTSARNQCIAALEGLTEEEWLDRAAKREEPTR